jgi:hypothetical protein
LSLDEINAGGYCRQRRLRSVYLGRYQNSAGLQSLHISSPDLPERQRDQRRALRDRRVQQLWAIRKRPGGQADTKRQAPTVARDRRLTLENLDFHVAADAEHPQAAGTTDRPREFSVGYARHRRADHGIPDSELVGKPRDQRLKPFALPRKQDPTHALGLDLYRPTNLRARQLAVAFRCG